MKTFILVLILALFSLKSGAQEVIATAGDTATATNISLSWTVGEVAVETYGDTTIQLTQGFHQTNFIFVSVQNTFSEEMEIDVFPNPVSDYATITLSQTGKELSWYIFDMAGKEVSSGSIQGRETKISLSGLTASMYFLMITGPENQKASFKIIKQ